MKYIKTYEDSMTSTPKFGDYVYCEVKEGEYEPNKFIGKLIKIKGLNSTFPYEVKYPLTEVTGWKKSIEKPRIIRKDEVKFFSKNLDDVNMFANQIKYNL